MITCLAASQRLIDLRD